MPAVGRERLEAGDEDLRRAAAFVGARGRRLAQLQARGLRTGVDAQLGQVVAHRQQVADADVDQRAEAGRRALRRAGIEQVVQALRDVDAVGGELVDLVAARQLERQPSRRR